MSMLPGSTKNHCSHLVRQGNLDFLSVSAIFGANASGKSNIYKALRFSKDFISKGTEIDKKSYFRLIPEYKDEPSTFEYEFMIHGTIYRYGFQIIVFTGEIVGEWLWRVSDNEAVDDVLIFSRPLDSESPKYITSLKPVDKYLILTLTENLRGKTDPKIIELLEVHDWFKDKLKVIGTDDNLLDELEYTDEQCQELGQLLGDFDVGVFSVGFNPVDNSRIKSKSIWLTDKYVINDRCVQMTPKGLQKENMDSPGRNKSMVLTNNHGSKEELFLWYDESDGTRRIMDLAPIIISPAEDVTYVVDELDRSLHPLVVYEFVRRFANQRSTGVPKQLLFTTHQTCLLDQDLLRRDEIWFVQKEREGYSELYSLDRFKERFDKKIDKEYLRGGYYAIPRIQRGDW